jgi:hypothetical protein
MNYMDATNEKLIINSLKEFIKDEDNEDIWMETFLKYFSKHLLKSEMVKNSKSIYDFILNYSSIGISIKEPVPTGSSNGQATLFSKKSDL